MLSLCMMGKKHLKAHIKAWVAGLSVGLYDVVIKSYMHTNMDVYTPTGNKICGKHCSLLIVFICNENESRHCSSWTSH